MPTQGPSHVRRDVELYLSFRCFAPASSPHKHMRRAGAAPTPRCPSSDAIGWHEYVVSFEFGDKGVGSM
jgi:hypothetical protein